MKELFEVFSKSVAQQLVDELLEAEDKRSPIDPLTDRYPNISIKDAYEIQLSVLETKKKRGHLVVGKKIGLTSKGMQKLLGVYEPDYGHITDRMVLYEGEPVKMQELLQPKVEAELAFIINRDLKGPGVTVADVFRATEGVMPAIEVIDSRVRDWKIKIQDTVADNASSARVVLAGKIFPVQGVDLRLVGMIFDENGEFAASSAGAAVLGNPAQAVAWLANKLSEFNVSLRAGEIVMSGSLIAAQNAVAGDCFTACFDRFGSVTVKFQ